MRLFTYSTTTLPFNAVVYICTSATINHFNIHSPSISIPPSISNGSLTGRYLISLIGADDAACFPMISQQLVELFNRQRPTGGYASPFSLPSRQTNAGKRHRLLTLRGFTLDKRLPQGPTGFLRRIC